MQSSRRIAWVDYAKGIAIIGVFILHSNAPEGVIHVVDAFCMPLFFLLSGFVFSIRRYSSFRSFLWNRLRTLIFPGIFFAVIPFARERVIGMFSGRVWTAKAYAEWVLGIVINLRGHEGFGSIPWFLACLFVVEIGGYILLRLSKRVSLPEWAFIGIGVVSMLIGYLYSSFIHIVLPWGMDIALSMFGFFVFGCVLRSHRETMEHVMHPFTAVIAVALLMAATILNAWQPVNVYMNTYGNIGCYLVGAFAGIWAILAICIVLGRIPADRFLFPAIIYCGRNTLVFYCVNAPIYGSLIPSILGWVGLDTNGGSVTNQLLCMLGAIVINLIICSAVAEIMNRWMPEVLGKTRTCH